MKYNIESKNLMKDLDITGLIKDFDYYEISFVN